MLLMLAIFAVSVPAYAAYLHMTGNLHVVEAGVLYRSGRLDRGQLVDVVTQRGIRTVVNLEKGLTKPLEASVVEGYGLRYVHFPLDGGDIPPLPRMITLADILADAPRPILIHCSNGANRTGLASAIFELAVLGRSDDDAAGALSIVYGHFPWFGSRTAAMDRAFEAFAAYWKSDRLAVAQ